MLIDRFAMKPDPDFGRLLKVVRREGRPDRVPFIELAISGHVFDEALGLPSLARNMPRSEAARESLRRRVRFMHRAGYDAVTCSADVKLSAPKRDARDPSDPDRTRSWVVESDSPVKTWEEFEQYPWPRYEDIDFGPFEHFSQILPEGMKALGHTGGVFEYSSRILGYENMCYQLLDDRELVRAVIDRCGEHLERIYRTFMAYEVVGAGWISDDLGHKTQTMISPEDLREFILPWWKRLSEIIRDAGKPVLLHSCGNLSALMDDVIDEVGIDAKHSFEDVIQPVADFKSEYGDRLAVLGGVDMDRLCRQDEDGVRETVRGVLDACASDGGYALGSGNSIANFVPTRNYLTMLDEGWRWSVEHA